MPGRRIVGERKKSQNANNKACSHKCVRFDDEGGFYQALRKRFLSPHHHRSIAPQLAAHPPAFPSLCCCALYNILRWCFSWRNSNRSSLLKWSSGSLRRNSSRMASFWAVEYNSHLFQTRDCGVPFLLLTVLLCGTVCSSRQRQFFQAFSEVNDSPKRGSTLCRRFMPNKWR